MISIFNQPTWEMDTGVLRYAPLRIRKNSTRVVYLQKDPMVATGINGVVSYASIKHGLKVKQCFYKV